MNTQSKLRILMKKYLAKWKYKENNYFIAEDEDWKEALREIEPESLRCLNSLNIISIILTAHIHHGINVAEVAKIVQQIIGGEKYILQLFDILKQVSYRRVLARIYYCASYASQSFASGKVKEIMNDPPDYLTPHIAEIKLSVDEANPATAVECYAQTLKNSGDTQGQKMALQVLDEEFSA